MKNKLIASLAAIGALCATSAPAVAGGASVKITDYKFTARTLHVSRGTTVTWHWGGKDKHNVTGPGFASRTQLKGSFSHRFAKAGTYHYVCTIHKKSGMTGTVVVG